MFFKAFSELRQVIGPKATVVIPTLLFDIQPACFLTANLTKDALECKLKPSIIRYFGLRTQCRLGLNRELEGGGTLVWSVTTLRRAFLCRKFGCLSQVVFDSSGSDSTLCASMTGCPRQCLPFPHGVCWVVLRWSLFALADWFGACSDVGNIPGPHFKLHVYRLFVSQ